MREPFGPSLIRCALELFAGIGVGVGGALSLLFIVVELLGKVL